MNRLVRTTPLVGLALLGTLMTAIAPRAVQASSRLHSANYHPTVGIDNLGRGLSDQSLGFATHWECVTNIAIPTDPFTCTRVKGANATIVPPTGLSGLVQGPSTSPLGIGRHAPLSGITESSCGYSGGVKLFETANLGGNCARFTGAGSIDLTAIDFYGSSQPVGQNVSSLSTLGSSGHRDFTCGDGSQFNFSAGTQYNYVGNGCNDNGETLYAS